MHIYYLTNMLTLNNLYPSNKCCLVFFLDDLENAILLAANAIYFKGVWRSQFPHKNTHKGGFYVNPTNVVNDIEYMTNTDSYFFTDSKELRAQIIRMPYKVIFFQKQAKNK